MPETTTQTAARSARRPSARDQLSDRLSDPLAPKAGALQADGGALAGSTPREVAGSGIDGAGAPLPHRERIQSSFGRHDVSGVAAHTDAAAVGANQALGSRGYALGNHVALATNDLHTVAHEAAHTVQQSEGVQLADGIGTKGDAYERHADAVADAVVAGRSAEPILDDAPSGSGGTGVQFDMDEGDVPALASPDKINQDDTPVYALAQGGGSFTTVSTDTKIQLGALAHGRYKIKWFAWNSHQKGFVTKEGYVEQARVDLGGTAQTAIDDDDGTARILPANVGGIRQRDVFQANLSDCYFQAAMAAVANTQPQAILDAIEVDDGTVTVKFYLKDDNSEATAQEEAGLRQQSITVAQSLLIGADGKLVYGGKLAPGAYLWPAFMAKAWAVVKGSYKNAAMGQVGDAFRAITGQGTSAGIVRGDTGAAAWPIYAKLRDALAAGNPAALGTGNFAKEGDWKQWLNSWKGDGPVDMPQGKVRNLHGYAVFALSNMALQEAAFANAVPSVNVTLRDPRDASGSTFTRKLADIVSSGKYITIHTG